jgi:hypothetical protein
VVFLSDVEGSRKDDGGEGKAYERALTVTLLGVQRRCVGEVAVSEWGFGVSMAATVASTPADRALLVRKPRTRPRNRQCTQYSTYYDCYQMGTVLKSLVVT